MTGGLRLQRDGRGGCGLGSAPRLSSQRPLRPTHPAHLRPTSRRSHLLPLSRRRARRCGGSAASASARRRCRCAVVVNSLPSGGGWPTMLCVGFPIRDKGRMCAFPLAPPCANTATSISHPLPPHSQSLLVQTLVDPEAAAKRKIRKQQRKAAGKRKQMEHVKRLRSAGVAGEQRTWGGCERGSGPCLGRPCALPALAGVATRSGGHGGSRGTPSASTGLHCMDRDATQLTHSN